MILSLSAITYKTLNIINSLSSKRRITSLVFHFYLKFYCYNAPQNGFMIGDSAKPKDKGNET